MKSLAMVVGVFVMALGLTGLVSPDVLIRVGEFSVTAVGLYTVAAVRVAIAIVFILVAKETRTPRIISALGVIVLIGGLTTPLLGVDRASAILTWVSAQGPAFIRVTAGLAWILGMLITYTIAAGRRPGLA